MNNYNLLPQPRHIHLTKGFLTLGSNKLIVLKINEPQMGLLAAKEAQKSIQEKYHFTWDISASPTIPESNIGIEIQLRPELVGHSQGYHLSIGPDQIKILANDYAGIYYGICSLKQILSLAHAEYGGLPPCLEIVDWPDFPARGVMLDVSRDKVPTMETLRRLIDFLASIKINQFQLYTEHTFAYINHPSVWQNASPITGEEILELDRYCQERFIELVPNQNSFGHLHRWLNLPEYAQLGESFRLNPSQGEGKGSFSLSPILPQSLSFITSLYDELLPHFSSRMFNIGCDETFDLGIGQSKEAVERYGKGRVYLDFILKLYADITQRGRTVQFWGDIILDYPELIPQLPRDLIALEWGYEADHPFQNRTEKFASSGIPFYVCPGTSAWNSISGRTENAIGNLKNAAEAGIQWGAIGYLNTDWGDNGHWQVLPVSYLGYAAGAAYSWAYQANKDIPIPVVLDRHVFYDSKSVLGNIAYQLGNVYKLIGLRLPNASPLFEILQSPLGKIKEYKNHIRIGEIQEIDMNLTQISELLRSADPKTEDGDWVKREFQLALRMLSHASKRARAALGETSINKIEFLKDWNDIISEYETIWHIRNRPGGFMDSMRRFKIAQSDYTG